MLYTMLLGEPPADVHLAPGCSTAAQLCFPQQPVLGEEAKELLVALLRCDSSSTYGIILC
jgi:hypothetical protein